MSVLIKLNKHKAAVILGDERAKEAGQKISKDQRHAAKTVTNAAAKLGSYSHVNVKKKKKK